MKVGLSGPIYFFSQIYLQRFLIQFLRSGTKKIIEKPGIFNNSQY